MYFRRLPFVLLLVLVIGLLGCPPRDPAPPPAPSNDEEPPLEPDGPTTAHLPNVPVPDLIRANAARERGQDALPVLQRLGEPRHIDRATQPNRHQPAEMDTSYVYHYDGLELDFMRTYQGREIIRAIQITHERHDTPQLVRVGMTRDEVRERLGEPDERSDGEERYSVILDDVGPEETLAVSYRENRVVRIRYGFYVD